MIIRINGAVLEPFQSVQTPTWETKIHDWYSQADYIAQSSPSTDAAHQHLCGMAQTNAAIWYDTKAIAAGVADGLWQGAKLAWNLPWDAGKWAAEFTFQTGHDVLHQAVIETIRNIAGG